LASHHDTRFPNEPESYRVARDALLTAEMELRARAEEVAGMRRDLPLGGTLKEDYVLTEGPADLQLEGNEGQTTFSELFAPGKDTLAVYSFMLPPGGNACPACTSLIDGLDGMAPHIQDKMNFAVFAKAPIAEFRAWGRTRGWQNVRLLSTGATSYNADYHTETNEQSQTPAINVFLKTDEGIFHTWGSEMFFAPSPDGMHPRHVDTIWPLWNVFDLTPDGRGFDWFPRNSYE
jgi:predicted dithiol-disulfide oxidoreductase (DUF899 family)